VLGVNYSWLAAGELPMVSTNNLKNYKVTHLTWNNLGRYNEDQKTLKLVSDYVFINVDNCDGCFALTLHDNSLEPRISNETILIFDKSIVATNNDFILVKLATKKVFLVRQLQIVNNKKYLLPINQDIYKVIKMTELDLIVAVMIQTIQDFKQREKNDNL
jgi:hypothetical protein